MLKVTTPDYGIPFRVRLDWSWLTRTRALRPEASRTGPLARVGDRTAQPVPSGLHS